MQTPSSKLVRLLSFPASPGGCFYLIAAAMLLPATTHAQGGTPLWTNSYDGPRTYNYGTAVATETNGIVYVTGLSYGIDTIYDYATLAYSSAGEPLWTNRYDGWASDRDVPCAIAVNSSGIVFVTGTSQTSPGHSEYVTVAYSGAGDLFWVNSYAGLGNGGNGASDLAVDSRGDVVVTGSSAGGSTLAGEWATIKYSSDGSPLWTNLYNMPGVVDDAPSALAIDRSGNVVVSGGSGTGGGWTSDATTIKYSAAGEPLWTNHYHGPINGTDSGAGVAVDTSGNVFVLCTSAGSGGNPSYDYATIKYSSAGVPLWTNRYDGRGKQLGDVPVAIVVDGNGNATVTGYSDNGTDYDYATMKYSSVGVALWTNRYNGDANGDDQAEAMAVDASGNVFVTGWSPPIGYLTIAYSSAGVPLWTNRYEQYGGAYAIAVDPSGNVVVTGMAGGSPNTMATVKYAAVSPSLSMSRVGSQVRIAWASSATGWALRRASAVGGPYNDPGLSVTSEANESVAYDNLAAGSRFYRLEQSP
jgi:hypothetical protein